MNGKLTLGENIGDLGGLTIAYLALQKSLKGTAAPPKIDGFTPEQRFFLGWAQVWRTLQSDAAAKAQVNTNPHAPAKWRVDGPLSNMPEFKAAWGCKDGDRDGAAGLVSARESGSSSVNSNYFTAEAQRRRGTRGGLHGATNRMFLLKAARDGTSWRRKPPRYE